MTTSKPPSPSSSPALSDYGVGPEVPGHLAASLVGLDDGHGYGAHPSGQGDQQQPHGAGAVDEEAVAQLGPEQVIAVHGARQGLDDGGHGHVEAVGQEVDVPRRYRQVLGAGPRVGNAQGPEVEAHVAVPLAAGPAAAAIIVGVGRDLGPDSDRRHVLAYGDHLTGELVPRHQRVNGPRKLPVGEVDVRAADTAGPHLDDHFVRSRGRVGDLAYVHVARLVDHHRLHGCPSSPALPGTRRPI